MAIPVLLMLTSGVLAAGALGPSAATIDVLADALGRAHALHRACAGPSDDLWRARMQALLAVERAPPARRARLIGDFNLGYSEAAEAFPVCTPRGRAALRAALEAGRDSAARLAEAPSVSP